MDDEDDDGGWAGAHGEVDYSAKLNFEDFDEEDKDWHKENIERRGKEQNKDEERHPQDSEREQVEPREPVILRRPPPVSIFLLTAKYTGSPNVNQKTCMLIIYFYV